MLPKHLELHQYSNAKYAARADIPDTSEMVVPILKKDMENHAHHCCTCPAVYHRNKRRCTSRFTRPRVPLTFEELAAVIDVASLMELKSRKLHMIDFTEVPAQQRDMYHVIFDYHSYFMDTFHHTCKMTEAPLLKICSEARQKKPNHLAMHMSRNSSYLFDVFGTVACTTCNRSPLLHILRYASHRRQLMQDALHRHLKRRYEVRHDDITDGLTDEDSE